MGIKPLKLLFFVLQYFLLFKLDKSVAENSSIKHLPIARDFVVALPSITGEQEYNIVLEVWDIPNNRQEPRKTTENLQKAIDWAHGNGYSKVILPPGHYLLGIEAAAKYPWGWTKGKNREDNFAMHGLTVPSNMELILDSSAVLEMVSNDKVMYCIICIEDVTDVIIRGGTLKGDRQTHIFTPHHNRTTHEWGHGILISNKVHRILVTNMEIKDVTGDGVYVRTEKSYKGSDITIKNNDIHNARRQGVSIVGGLRVKIENNEIHHIKGISPQFGVDIEGPWTITKDVVIHRNNFHDNRGGDVVNSDGKNVFITENMMVESDSYSYVDGPLVTHHKTYQVIAHNNITMKTESVNGLLGYIQYSRGGPKGHNHTTYVHDNYCQGCGMYMYKSADADIRRNKFIGYFLGLVHFQNAVVVDNHVEVPKKRDVCNWSYRFKNTTGKAMGNTYATNSEPDNVEPYQIPLNEQQPWTRPC